MNSQTLPPPQGPEYTPCGCGHIVPEHRPDAGPCLVCDCAAYRPVDETAVERVARRLAARERLSDEARWGETSPEFRDLYRGAAREVIALAQEPGAEPAGGRAALRDRIADILRPHANLGGAPLEYALPFFDGATPSLPRISGWKPLEDVADAVLAVMPEPADRGAVLREAADELDARMERFFSEWPDEPRNSPYALGQKDAAAELRRMADETPAAACGRPASMATPCSAGDHCCKGPAGEAHVVADGSDDLEHVDDCPGCEAFTLTGHVAAPQDGARPSV